MYFSDLDLIPDQSKNDLHYHADYIEIIALSKGIDGVRFDELKSKYNEQDITDFIEVIRERTIAYGEKYPFSLDSNLGLAKNKSLNNAHVLYIFLLICSHTNKLKIKPSELRSKFELISKLALESYLPSVAVCHNIGKSSNNTGHYIGSLVDKLNKLSDDLKCMKTFEKDDFSKKNSGDLGLDVVAWVPFSGDQYFHRIMQTYLCQCATGKDWVKKQAEPDKIKNVLKMPKATVNTLFIPYDLRKSDGNFHNFHEITINLLFDRRRIFNLCVDLTSLQPALGDLVDAIKNIVEYEPGLVE